MCSKSTILLFIVAFVLCAACKKEYGERRSAQTTPSPASAQSSTSPQTASPGNGISSSGARTDACALLTAAEIEAVQREKVKETKLSGSNEGGFSVSHCFFTLPTFTNSISLQITQRADGPNARDPKTFWRDTFHREHKFEEEREQEGEGDSAPPIKLSGIGDEAFWMGTRVGGALYVLKGNSYVRVSVGGSGEESDKIRRSKQLAQKVAAKL